MDVRTLHHGWTLRPVAGDLPPEVRAASDAGPLAAVVPGSVHTDLLAAGLIPDPYAAQHEQELAWLHRTGWEYAHRLTEAAPQPGERVDLQFDGLDTVATVTLGDLVLGRTQNMHRRHRFDLTPHLGDGPRDLRVRFDSALEHAETVEKDLGRRPRAYDHPFNAVRKMACSFGWDWGPDLQTAGIWRPVTVSRWRTARLAGVRPLATLDGSTGRLAVHVEVERSGLEEAGELTVGVRVRDLPGRDDLTATLSLDPATTTGVVQVEVPDAPVWWPRGHGDQPLVSVDVDLRAGEDALDALDARTLRTGFRDVRLDGSADEFGTRSTLVVNGVPLFAKGVNWIPRDHLLTRLDRERYAAALTDAVDAHCNLVRVWGGGIYEDDAFYELCDELGLLVWQDFLLACAAYAEEEPLRSEIEAEARENVARLAHHPALAVWNGGNENLWGHEDWGWKEELGGSTWGQGYYDEVFPAVLAELDPTKVYVPGSPSSPGAPGVHPNDPDHGTHHVWDVWNSEDWTAYRDRVPRFCSEFGFQAPPSAATLAELLVPEQRAKTSPVFLAHQKAQDGNGKLDRGMEPHTGVPEGFADWVWAGQLNQARAITFSVEHFRSWWPRTAGSVYWQLDDCWPSTSWAVVDGAGRRKPGFHALKHAHAPRLLTVQPRDGEDHLVLVNDTALPWTARVGGRVTTLTGRTVRAEDFTVEVAPRSVSSTPLPAALTGFAPATELLTLDASGLRAVQVLAEDRDVAWDPEPLHAAVTAVADGYTVRVHARSAARDVTLLADAVAPDAVVDDGLVTLLAGESRTFHVRTRTRVDPAGFTHRDVLRTANQFGAHR